MPSKDKKVISAKISESRYGQIETYANTHNMSISAIITICIDGIINGDIEIEKGELKTGVDPIGCAVFEEIDTPFGIKIEKKLDKLRERDYPESFIESIKEQMLNGLDSQIETLPKRFDMRKARGEWGC